MVGDVWGEGYYHEGPTVSTSSTPYDVRVLGLTRYGYAGSSSRDRFYHYQPYLERQGIDMVIEPLLDDSYITQLYAGHRASIAWLAYRYLRRLLKLVECRRYDLLFVEKELLVMVPAWFERLLGRLGVPYAVDFDDAVFHNYDLHKNPLVRRYLGSKIPDVMRNSALVIAGNPYIGEFAEKAGARRVELLPTAVDSGLYSFSPRRCTDRFTIGWVGSPSTAVHLLPIAETLAELTRSDDMRLVVFGAKDLRLEGVRLEAPPWSEAAEPGLIHQFDVGIGPAIDAPFERGKCGFKLIKYMSCGRAVVTTPVGMNRDIVIDGVTGFHADTNAEWTKRLVGLKNDSALTTRMGEAGRKRVEEKYSLEVNAPRLGALLRSVL